MTESMDNVLQSQPMKDHKKLKLFFLIFFKVCFFSCFLYFVYKKIDVQSVFLDIKNSDFGYIFCAIFVLWIGYYTSCYRWRYLLLATENIALPQKKAFFQIFKGLALSQVLPSSLGGDAYRMMALSKYVPVKKSLLIILMDRFIGLSMFFMFSLLASPFFIKILKESVIGYFLGFSLIGFLLGISFGLLIRPYLIKILPSLDKYYTVFYSIFKRKYFFRLLISSVVCGVFFVLPVYLIGRALGVPLSAPCYFLVMPLIFIGTSLPISFAGWGVREGLFIMFLGVFGISNEASLALSIIYGVVMLLTALPFISLFFLSDER
ncbi:MAG: hypothetical protein HEEMFOPI_00824 [Holosporales bacterium]